MEQSRAQLIAARHKMRNGPVTARSPAVRSPFRGAVSSRVASLMEERVGSGLRGALLEEDMEAMVAKQKDGQSLSDIGYISVGLDDAWQGFNSGTPGVDACQRGYNGTFHDEQGNPLWAKATFPDPAGMVAKAHDLGLKAGWYMNNCREQEKIATATAVHCVVARHSLDSGL